MKHIPASVGNGRSALATSRYLPSRCPCSCGAHLVVDVLYHRAVATGLTESEAREVAAGLNGHRCPPAGDRIGCPHCAETVAVLTPAERVREWAMVAAGSVVVAGVGYVGLVGFVTVLG